MELETRAHLCELEKTVHTRQQQQQIITLQTVSNEHQQDKVER